MRAASGGALAPEPPRATGVGHWPVACGDERCSAKLPCAHWIGPEVWVCVLGVLCIRDIVYQQNTFVSMIHRSCVRFWIIFSLFLRPDISQIWDRTSFGLHGPITNRSSLFLRRPISNRTSILDVSFVWMSDLRWDVFLDVRSQITCLRCPPSDRTLIFFEIVKVRHFDNWFFEIINSVHFWMWICWDDQLATFNFFE